MSLVLNGTTGITNPGAYTGDGVSFADGTPSNTLVTTTGGRVGIGTSSPGRSLSVLGQGVGTVLKLEGGVPSVYMQLSYNGATDGQSGYIGYTSSQAMEFYTVNTERMRIDSAGNVGIGTSSPQSNAKLSISGNNSVFPAVYLENTADSKAYSTRVASSSWIIRDVTAGADRVTLDSSGNLLVGQTAVPLAGDGQFFNQTGRWTTRQGGGGIYALFLNNSGNEIGRISNNSNTSTTYATSSDYRLKHDIQPMTGALAKVAQLKPVTYKWNVDDSQSQGFIAHELQEVVPECVTGEKDAVDAEGKPVYQGIDTSFLVATLTAAIQEQQAIIEQLKADVAALKGAQG
jgi:hypothetical protein